MIKNSLANKVLSSDNRKFLLLDTIIFILAPLISAIIRLDNLSSLEQYTSGLLIATIIFLIIKLSVFITCNLYKHYWRYASIDELIQIAVLTIAAIILEVLVFAFLELILSVRLIPSSLPLLDGILSFIMVGGTRFSIRALERNRQKNKQLSHRNQTVPGLPERVLIAGAGNAGVSLLQEMQRNPKLGLDPVAFIDDDPRKLNLQIRGIPIVGNRFEIPEIVSSLNINQVVIAMPTAPGQVIREIVDISQAIGIKTSTLPGIHEILNDSQNLKVVREVKIEDLLRRESIKTDTQKVVQFIQGKRVLITGAGGSIGSELCRQIFRCRPAEMILVGHGENSVFSIEQELKQVLQILRQENNSTKKLTKIFAFIADLRFRDRLENAFLRYQPDIVFHAAAHKHVPLMESNPPEAITNNVLGTKNLLDLAIEYDVQHFVMISTDKAVNPTNVMGASKRVAELLVLQAAKKSDRPFVVVRFGNVLGSRGSVVPTFQRQIAKGGPITITHPEICRYFMTIPEAVQLVLQASVLSYPGQIFMLNMGQPVKIVDLAKDLIRLSGYEVGKDIEIVYTGLRPGEKLFEELLIPGEKYTKTEHEKLLVVDNASSMVPIALNWPIAALCKAAAKNDSNTILFLLEQLIPGYNPQYLKTDFVPPASAENTVQPKIQRM